jgi:hypothetical protein
MSEAASLSTAGVLSHEVFASVTVPDGSAVAASFVAPDNDLIVTPDLFV